MNILLVLWRELRAPRAPGPIWRDWVLVATVWGLCILEGLLREGLVWPAASCALTMAIALVLPWRRLHPLGVLLLAFGLNAVPQVGARALDVEWTPVATTIFMLIFPYSLLRWASGREAFAGLCFVFFTFALTIGASGVPLREIVAGVLFLLFPAAVGASVRYRDAADTRAIEQVRLREREQLARELHDTVAHHVSAIAIQAQAGKALAATRPEASLAALETIEEAASKTLAEMRRMVRTMRSQADAPLAPAAAIADIERLVQDKTFPLKVHVNLTGDLDSLDATLVSTLYRLTQESMTNAVRHAQRANSLRVHIAGDAQQVHLTIEDDGDGIVGPCAPGLGVRGMTERAALLGGTLHAGPGEEGGWKVAATLPRMALSQ